VIPINETARYIQTWTRHQCLPVANIVFEPSGSVNYIGYYDITLGINDPSVFIPPQQCLRRAEVPIRYFPFNQRTKYWLRSVAVATPFFE
jgi:hypothetical protein